MNANGCEGWRLHGHALNTFLQSGFLDAGNVKSFGAVGSYIVQADKPENEFQVGIFIFVCF